MNTIKVFIKSLIYYSELRKLFPAYATGRFQYALFIVRCNKKKSLEMPVTSEKIPEWECRYMVEPIYHSEGESDKKSI